MIRLDLAYFYRLGVDFSNFRHMESEVQLKAGPWHAMLELKRGIWQLLSDPTIGDALRGSQQLGLAVIGLLDILIDRDWEETYTAHDRANLIVSINRFEIVLASELSVADAYYVSERKPYNARTLISEGEALFPLDLPRKVPEAVHDLREAGKCLAFELPTACAFHTHRAVEAILRRYWQKVTGQPPKLKQRNIGVYLLGLEKLGCADPKVISSLRQLKDLHRNVIIHPDSSLIAEEAAALLGIANSVSLYMLNDLPFVQTDPPSPDSQSFPADGLENSFADNLSEVELVK